MNNHDDYFVLDILVNVQEMSLIERRKVGAIIGNDYNIVKGRGFNSVVLANNRDNIQENFQVHAEMKALAWAAKKGYHTEGATLYCTIPPCPVCCSLIIEAGIKRVVYIEDYWSTNNLYLLTKAGIEVKKFEE